MPSIIGAVKIDSISDGAFTIGDTFRLSPSGSSHDKGGEGSFNTGDFLVILDKVSAVNGNELNILDQFTLSINPLRKL